jgi:hemerythrin-like domain-containing protein
MLAGMSEIPVSPAKNGLVRHPALVALSRDHHTALVQALGLRRARAATAVAVAEAFLRFHADELVGHFADEEDVLLPAAAALPGVARVLAEHQALHALTQDLRDALAHGAVPAELLHRIGDALHDHVRFEERAFFMDVQQQLGAPALAALERALYAHRQVRGRGESCAL